MKSLGFATKCHCNWGGPILLQMTLFTVKDDKRVLNTTGHSQNLIKSTLEYSNLGFQHYSTFTHWTFHFAQNSHTIYVNVLYVAYVYTCTQIYAVKIK